MVTHSTTPFSFDKLLAEWLPLYQNPVAVHEAFLTHASLAQLNLEQQKQVTSFYWQSGQERALLALYQIWIVQPQGCAWSHLTETLARLECLDETFAELLFEGAKALNQESELAKSRQLDSYWPILKEVRQEQQAIFLRKKWAYQKRLWDEFETYRSQGLEPQALLKIKELRQLDPQNPTYQQAAEELRLQQAFQILEQQSLTPEKKWVQDFIHQHQKTTPTTWPWQDWVLHIQQQIPVNEQSDYFYALAVHCYQSEDYEGALGCLTHNELYAHQQEGAWLKIEILKAQKRYLLALDELVQMEKQFHAQYEVLLAIQYEMAWLLFHLDKKKAALDIMQEIAIQYPEYRQAEFWFTQWSRHE